MRDLAKVTDKCVNSPMTTFHKKPAKRKNRKAVNYFITY